MIDKLACAAVTVVEQVLRIAHGPAAVVRRFGLADYVVADGVLDAATPHQPTPPTRTCCTPVSNTTTTSANTTSAPATTTSPTADSTAPTPTPETIPTRKAYTNTTTVTTIQ